MREATTTIHTEPRPTLRCCGSPEADDCLRTHQLPLAPVGWRLRPSHPTFDLQVSFERTLSGESVILSLAEWDGRHWIHFSVAHPSRIPHWDEIVRYKEHFLGSETTALQVVAPRSKWVNIHPYCLHLFVSLDGDAVPDFTCGTGSL